MFELEGLATRDGRPFGLPRSSVMSPPGVLVGVRGLVARP